MQKILLGPAGSPAKSTLEGLSAVKKLELQAMEVQFTHGVGMGLPLAKQIGEENRSIGISLSVHAPYYINLASEERKKIEESKKRILDSCERGHLMNAMKEPMTIVFHSGYYGKRSKEETYDIIKNEIADMMKTIREKKWNVLLAPEIGGKHSAFGSLDELLSLVKELKCSVCIDLAHLYARNNGKIDYAEILDKVERARFKHYHFHFSGISYTEKGEKAHLLLGKPDFAGFAKELLKRKIDCTIISETPVTWKDSLKMKNILRNLGYRFS
jgi:deoxyribonuclease-4